MEWLVYFPLFPLDCVYDVLSRICGSCYRREEYVLDQMNYLYRSIPESDMKKVADRLAECVRGCGEGKIPSDDDIKTYKELVQKKMDIEDRLYRIRSLIEKSCQIAEE